MNKLCVVAKNKETYFIKRLIEEVGQGVVLFDPWSDYELPEASVYLVRTTGVYRSELDLMLLKTLPAEKIVNNLNSLIKFRTKNHQYEWFESENLPALPWLSLKGKELITVEKFFRLYPEAVVKPLTGQGGWGVEGLSWEKFKSWKKSLGQDDDYLLQPFIKNAIELRYFFIKGTRPIVLERKSKSGLAANFRKQGEAKLSALPIELEPMLNEVVDKSSLIYGAVDLIIKDGHPYILEVNSVPGIEQLEKVSGINVLRPLIRALNI